ncbi:hypothetical protein [Acetobacter oeni]|uniref:Uncharacterized protein n=1 Tax=Acetobacter oeni TaxID=304077 RepID=A0A511XLN0_9PROT|nr:hypothetical protein [Acetobacter oeni]MBB3884294.1 hypothetical protein [Acetobacter oeni]NHO20258.1 hypothetical protein [Acetobacter oeni]GBR07682.1 hypothetical protein AA21952_2408 [Acetobacter oeni LMG 21952]GEN63849.1 hypothetical protein AOE01nite_20730 [Acetobacter oeni]
MEQSTLARRGLLASVIGMGILIVAGTGVLLAVIVHRMSHPTSLSLPASSPPLIEKTVTIHEPAGTAIKQIAWQNGSLLALHLTGGGEDRIVIWDTSSGRIIGRLQLAP